LIWLSSFERYLRDARRRRRRSEEEGGEERECVCVKIIK
jgi:hypothetical protein